MTGGKYVFTGETMEYGELWIIESAKVFDNATITGCGTIGDNARIGGNAYIHGRRYDSSSGFDPELYIGGDVKISGNAKISGAPTIKGNVELTGDVLLDVEPMETNYVWFSGEKGTWTGLSKSRVFNDIIAHSKEQKRGCYENLS